VSDLKNLATKFDRMSQYGQGQGYGQYGQGQQQQQQVRPGVTSATSATAGDEASTLFTSGFHMSAGLHRGGLPTAGLSAGKSATIHQQHAMQLPCSAATMHASDVHDAFLC
jgi:hypothetical protein